jgi:hypothetical protein
MILTNYVIFKRVFDDLEVCSAENGGKPRFLCLLGPGALLCYYSGGRDRLSHVAPNSGSWLWDSGGLHLWLRWTRWWFSCLQWWRHLLPSSKSLPSTACYDTETSSTSSSSSSGQSVITRRRLLAGSSASFRSIISFGFSLAEVPSEV